MNGVQPRQIAAWQATPTIHEWFLLRFPEGQAKYQDILNALAEDDRPNEAHWLMENAGAEDAVCLDVTNLEAHKHVFAAGKLSVATTLNIAGWLRAGLSIETDKSLSADLGIIAVRYVRTGGSLRTNGEIRAGSRIDAGRNISAGDCITGACAIVAGGDNGYCIETRLTSTSPTKLTCLLNGATKNVASELVNFEIIHFHATQFVACNTYSDQ